MSEEPSNQGCKNNYSKFLGEGEMLGMVLKKPYT